MLIAALAPAAFAADEFDAARAAFDRYREALTAVGEAMGRGDQAAVAAAESTAQQFLIQARREYELHRADNSRKPDVLAGYADVLQQMRDYDLAAKFYRAAAGYSPESPTLWLNLGMSLGHMGSSYRPEAVAALQRCVGMDGPPQLRGQAFIELGDLYRDMGIAPVAADYYRDARTLVPDSLEPPIALAAMELRQGRVTEAAQAIEALGNLPPDASGRLREHLGAALTHFEDRRLSFEDTAAAHLAYAKLLFLGGRYQDCPGPLERSAALDGNNAIAWNLLGSISRQLGNEQRAREAFARSLEINPDQPRTREALDALAQPPLSN